MSDEYTLRTDMDEDGEPVLCCHCEIPGDKTPLGDFDGKLCCELCAHTPVTDPFSEKWERNRLLNIQTRQLLEHIPVSDAQLQTVLMGKDADGNPKFFVLQTEGGNTVVYPLPCCPKCYKQMKEVPSDLIDVPGRRVSECRVFEYECDCEQG